MKDQIGGLSNSIPLMATFCEITFSFLEKLPDHTIYIYHTQYTAGFDLLDRRALDPRGTGQTAKLFCHSNFFVHEKNGRIESFVNDCFLDPKIPYPSKMHQPACRLRSIRAIPQNDLT